MLSIKALNMSDMLPKWWKMRKWRRSARLTDGELAVIRALLPKGDPRTERLVRQAESAPYIERILVSPGRCQIHIPYVEDSRNLIEASRDYQSPPISITDRKSGSQITFTLKIQRGGFLNEIVGVVATGNEWPLDWEVESPRASGVQLNWLPEELDDSAYQVMVRKLAEWAGIDAERLLGLGRDYLVVSPPASAQQVAQAEGRTGYPLPNEYLQLLNVSNGFTIAFGRPYDVFGSEDVYVTDLQPSGEPSLVITDLYEDGVIAMQLGHDGTSVVTLRAERADSYEVIGDLRKYVADTLKWAINSRKAGGG